MSYAADNRRPCGFTMVELLVVVLLVGLIASVATLKLHGVLVAARGEATTDRLLAVDAAARTHARTHHTPGTLWFDLQRQTVAWTTDGDPARIPTSDRSRSVPLDRAWTLAEVRTPSTGAFTGAFTGVEVGQVPVPIAATGFGSSYALRLTGPNDAERWVLVAGLTGDHRVTDTMPQELEAWRAP